MCVTIYNPIHIEKYNIYDIFLNTNYELVIISPSESSPLSKLVVNENTEFNLYTCPHNHTYVYVSKSSVGDVNSVMLKIYDDIITTDVNKYPNFPNEFVMSTLVKNENDYLIQWIEFHKNIGVNRFVIYDNTGHDNKQLASLLKSYLESSTVVLIKWAYPYRMPVSGISGQTTQQNHSIYAFRTCKYIGLFDVDEYINIQKGGADVSLCIERAMKENKVNPKDVGSIRLLNKFFYNPHDLPTHGYNFLKIFNCSQLIKRGHEKQIVIPTNVITFSVHTITSGKREYSINSDLLYFNHYYFLNKPTRGRNQTTYTDSSILTHAIKFLD